MDHSSQLASATHHIQLQSLESDSSVISSLHLLYFFTETQDISFSLVSGASYTLPGTHHMEKLRLSLHLLSLCLLSKYSLSISSSWSLICSLGWPQLSTKTPVPLLELPFFQKPPLQLFLYLLSPLASALLLSVTLELPTFSTKATLVCWDAPFTLLGPKIMWKERPLLWNLGHFWLVSQSTWGCPRLKFLSLQHLPSFPLFASILFLGEIKDVPLPPVPCLSTHSWSLLELFFSPVEFILGPFLLCVGSENSLTSQSLTANHLLSVQMNQWPNMTNSVFKFSETLPS